MQKSYADALAVIFIALTYGFVMPIIYIPTVLQLIILYYRDRFLSKQPNSNYNFQDFKVLFHKILFDHKMHKFARNFLKIVVLIWCFGFIWIFGNNNIFTYKDPREDAEEISGSFNEDGTVFSLEEGSNGVKIPKIFNTYLSLFLERAGTAPASFTILVSVGGYFMATFVSYSIQFLKKDLKKRKIKKNMGNVESFITKKYVEEGVLDKHFEDLLSMADIMYMRCLEKYPKNAQKTKNVIEQMHYERNKRAWRHLVRERRKENLIFNTETTKEGRSDPKKQKKESTSKFTTISSYDYRVSQCPP